MLEDHHLRAVEQFLVRYISCQMKKEQAPQGLTKGLHGSPGLNHCDTDQQLASKCPCYLSCPCGLLILTRVPALHPPTVQLLVSMDIWLASRGGLPSVAASFDGSEFLFESRYPSAMAPSVPSIRPPSAFRECELQLSAPATAHTRPPARQATPEVLICSNWSDVVFLTCSQLMLLMSQTDAFPGIPRVFQHMGRIPDGHLVESFSWMGSWPRHPLENPILSTQN